MGGISNIYKLTDTALALDRRPVDQRQDEDGDKPAHIVYTFVRVAICACNAVNCACKASTVGLGTTYETISS